MTLAGSALVCRELRLRQFRNFSEVDLTFPAAGVAVIGDNGAGKTNLLEALYYLEIFRSFRGAPDDQLVRFGASAFHVRGRFEEMGTGRIREISAAYEPRSRSKLVMVDGAEPERLGDAVGFLGAAVFSPSDMAVVAGAPGERRRFLDILLSLNQPGYLVALQRYRQALRQRNAMLRQGSSDVALSVWDEGLIAAGSRIVAARSAWVCTHTTSFANHYAEIGAAAVNARLVYRTSLSKAAGDGLTDEVAGTSFREALRRAAPRERERGATLVGPHRDDLAILMDGPNGEIDLRDFGSGGQLRTAAVALRLVEADTIRETRGRPPLVLLDDVFAELDPGRSRRIMELLDAGERGQVILTAPKDTDIGLGAGASGFTSTLQPWRIATGRIDS